MQMLYTELFKLYGFHGGCVRYKSTVGLCVRGGGNQTLTRVELDSDQCDDNGIDQQPGGTRSVHEIPCNSSLIHEIQ